MKKKVLSIVLVLTFLISLVGCGKKEVNNTESSNTEKIEEKTTVKIASLKGPTSMGLVKLFDDSNNEKQNNKYEYKIMASPDEIVTSLSKGEVDIAAIPANLASVLYNKTDGKLLKVSNINTLGVLYLASRDEYNDLSELKGKTIITSGKGASPEFVLRKLLEDNGIDPDNDINIEYKSQHEEVLTEFIKDENSIVMLPEPFLTVASKKVDGLKVNFSLNDIWEEENGEPLITGVTVVRNEFLEKNKEAFDSFLKEYKESVNFINENTEEGAKLVGDYDIVPEEIAKIAIPNCNIVYIDGEDSENSLSKYLELLFKASSDSVGGKLPDENFYYKK